MSRRISIPYQSSSPGLLSRLWHALRADAGGSPLSPSSDFWYGNPGFMSDAGVRVSPDTAMRLAAVFACVRVLSETIASLPLIVYRRLPDGGKARAVNHPLFSILHDNPNPWQTSFDFVEMMQAHLELRGNCFALIQPGPRGAIDSLIPLHPDRVQVYRLPDGRLQYQVQSWWDGTLRRYAQEEIFHNRGLSSNGITGMSPIALSSESVGAGLAQQEYVNRFYQNDSRPTGVLTHPNKLNQQAVDRVKASWQDAQTGANRHKVAILEEGMSYTSIGISNKDSQFLEARSFTRSEIAGIYRVPLHKIGDLSKATFSNIEQQALEFVIDSLRPRLVRWERRINMDLIEPLQIGEPQEYFAEFLVDALLRGDQAARCAYYSSGLMNGWLCPNEVRDKENLNPIEGGDIYLRQLNMTPLDTAPTVQPTASDEPDQEDDTATNALHLREYINAAAERVVRKEVTALRKAARQRCEECADSGCESCRCTCHSIKFAIACREFYSTHAVFVSQTMLLDRATAAEYVQENLILLQNLPPHEAIDMIESQAPEKLAARAQCLAIRRPACK